MDCPQTVDCADTVEEDPALGPNSSANSLAALFGETAHTADQIGAGEYLRETLENSLLRFSRYLARQETVSTLPDVSAAVCCTAGCVWHPDLSDRDGRKSGHRFANTLPGLWGPPGDVTASQLPTSM